MKLSGTSLITLATLAGTSYAGTSCVRQHNGGYFKYIVTADGVDDISGVCGKLWENLNRFWGAGCHAYTPTCGARGHGNPLYWEFGGAAGCNSGMVESSWWEATHNRWGSLHC